MIQGSDEWLEWRKQGLGASDAPIVMGVSPWKTRFKLWEEKLGLADDKPNTNPAMAMGHMWEPRIREMAENKLERRFPASEVVHKDKPHLRASLDGISECGELLECKLANKLDHEGAARGLVPDKYYPQLQHQMLVTGAKLCWYASFNEEESSFYLFKVDRDEEYISRLEKELDAFWELVIKKEPPKMTNKDFKVSLDKTVNKLAVEYKRVIDELAKLEEDKKLLKDQIVGLLDHEAVIMGDIKAQKVYRKGSVQYKDIPALKDMDLEQYRAEPTSYWVLK